LSGEVGAIDEQLGGYRLHDHNWSAMIKEGKMNKAGLLKFLQREILTDQSLASYWAKNWRLLSARNIDWFPAAPTTIVSLRKTIQGGSLFQENKPFKSFLTIFKITLDFEKSLAF
jgi:hypothetical protein